MIRTVLASTIAVATGICMAAAMGATLYRDEVTLGPPLSASQIESSIVDIEMSERLEDQRDALLAEAMRRGATLDTRRIRGAIVEDPALTNSSIYLTWAEPMQPLALSRALIDGPGRTGDALAVAFTAPGHIESGAACAIVDFGAGYSPDEFHRLWQCAERKQVESTLGVVTTANIEHAQRKGSEPAWTDMYQLRSIPQGDALDSADIDQRWVRPGPSSSTAPANTALDCVALRPSSMHLNLNFPHSPSLADEFMTVPAGICGNTLPRTAYVNGRPAGWGSELSGEIRDAAPAWNGIGAAYEIGEADPAQMFWKEISAVTVLACDLPAEIACDTSLSYDRLVHGPAP